MDRRRVREQVAQRKADILAAHAPLPGITDFIDRGAELGLQLGVASNSERCKVERDLDRLALRQRFSAIRCAEDVDETMPNPALYFSVCDAMNVSPTESIAIQSSPDGIVSAKGAGLYCISVPDRVTGSVSMDSADLVLVSLAAITLDEVVERASRQADSTN